MRRVAETDQSTEEHAAAQYRIGVIGGIGAYTMWGLFPLFFHRLEPTSPLEIIGHRVIWTAVLMVGVLSLGAGWGWVRPLLAAGAVTAAPLLAFGVATNRIPLSIIGLLQYLTPIIQFILGVFVFGEEVPPARLAGFACVWVALALLSADGLRQGHRQAGVRRAARTTATAAVQKAKTDGR